MGVVSIAVFKFIFKTLDISFIELTDFNLIQLDFSFIVFYHLLNFLFEFSVIISDLRESVFFISLQITIDVK